MSKGPTKKSGSWFACCGTKNQTKKSPTPPQQEPTIFNIYNTTNDVPNTPLFINYSKRRNIYYDDGRKINTKTSPFEVQYLETKPLGDAYKNIFKYVCPICFRYFNQILKSSCCENYMCHFCCLQYTQASLAKSNTMIGCHFCDIPDTKFIDVTPTKDIKKYSDSQPDLDNIIQSKAPTQK